MGWTPNRIVLKTRGRYDEAVAAVNCYPGMLLQQNMNAATVQPNASAGGGGLLMVAIEDALQGLDATQALPSGNVIPFLRPAKGDVLLFLLQNGQNVVEGQPLINAGDGTLMASPGTDLYEIEAPSTVITNTATETAFSNGSYSIPANFLQVGDVIHIRAKAFCVAVAAAATQRIRVYLGATPVTLADSTALALVANDVVLFNIDLTIRTITATGTFIADGTLAYTIAGTWTTTSFTVASTTLDSTVAEAIVIKALASAAATGNQIRLDEFFVTLNRLSGLIAPITAAEPINNSAGAGSSPMSGANSGTAAFIRGWVN